MPKQLTHIAIFGLGTQIRENDLPSSAQQQLRVFAVGFLLLDALGFISAGSPIHTST